MSTNINTVEAGGVTPPATVKVWDPFVRIFHWSLATLFMVAYATGDETEWLHIAAGYTIGGLVALRIVWGSSVPATRASATSSARRARCWPICAISLCSERRIISGIIRPAAP